MGTARTMISLLVLMAVCIYTAEGVVYTWDAPNCPSNHWNGETVMLCWHPAGLPGIKDDVIFPPNSNVIVDAYSQINYKYYLYGRTAYTAVNSIFVSKGASLTITDQVALYIGSNSTVDVGGTLNVFAYIGALDGPGDLFVSGLLNVTSGNIQGTGRLVIESSGNFTINSNSLSLFVVRESYLLRNTTLYGNMKMMGVVHVGFWWQPGNVSIAVEAGGSVTAAGFFSKNFEGLEPTNFKNTSGSIMIASGASFYFGREHFYINNVVNFGTSYMIAACLPPLATGSCSTFPYGVDFYNFGHIVYYNGNTDPSQVNNCEQLAKHIATQNNGNIVINLEEFAQLGPLMCESSPVLVVSDAKITFKGTGGLIFGMKLVLDNSILELEENVDVVFIKEFYATDSVFVVPENSEMKLMFMPYNEAAGYHNYLDKSVMVWPEDQKKIAFSGVKMIGGGAIEFLSELHLPEDSFVVQQGEVYFQREYNASSLTGPGDFIVGENSFASLGIESAFVGAGKIDVYGVVQVPGLASILNGRVITVHQGAKLDVEGRITTMDSAGEIFYTA
jgi:hypothetical protein